MTLKYIKRRLYAIPRRGRSRVIAEWSTDLAQSEINVVEAGLSP